MDYVALRDAYIDKAKKAEQDATAQAATWRRKAYRELELRKGRAFTNASQSEREAQANDLVNQWKQKDPVWKGHVANNQWYIQQAIMYGTAANGDLLQRLVDALSRTQIFSSYVK